MAFLAGLIPSVLGLAGKAAKTVTGAKAAPGGRRRRRRARLTPGEMQELATIKTILGKTAAANALPFYLGRGR